jgi:hypothetical protein
MKPLSRKRAKKLALDIVALLLLVLILAFVARLVGEDTSMLPWAKRIHRPKLRQLSRVHRGARSPAEAGSRLN